MPDLFRFISDYFWLIALGFSAFNYVKAKRDLSAQPPTVSGTNENAEVYLSRFAIASASPWLVMAAGQISGATPSVWYYFRPQDGNPFVLAWLGVIFILSTAFAWWVLFAGGARTVREFNLMAVVGQPNSGKSERAIKLTAAVGVLIFPVWVIAAVYMNAKVPY